MGIDELIVELNLLADQQEYRASLLPNSPLLEDLPNNEDIHEMACSLLLEFINDGRVMNAFRRLER